jgi:hypothetical protein
VTATLSERIVERTAGWLGRKTGRRSFLAKTAVVGSVLAVNPFRFLLRPGTAYAALCGPAADCGSGWSAMCCSVNGGNNSCPAGSIPGGWWKVDNSGFCNGGPRYYVDCNATCHCGCGGGAGICEPGCQSCGCHCNTGSCDERVVCCNQFRYGQCNQQIACVGSVVCRVILCTPPWNFDRTCTTSSATSNATALQDAPCLHVQYTPHYFAEVFAFGKATNYGQPKTQLNAPVTGMDRTPTGKGYWLVATDGGIFTFGDAQFHGSMGGRHLNQPIVDLAATPTGKGYWLVASDGGIFTFGDAQFHGSMGGRHLNQPIVGMAATHTGKGYWLVARDGGIFTFGDAKFFGSTGAKKLNKPIVGMASTSKDTGYWLVAADGGIFTFGSAGFHGSLAAHPLNAPIAAMTGTRTDNGYWMVGTDGGVFALGDAEYLGRAPIDGSAPVDIARIPTSDGYWVVTEKTTITKTVG